MQKLSFNILGRTHFTWNEIEYGDVIANKIAEFIFSYTWEKTCGIYALEVMKLKIIIHLATTYWSAFIY